MRQIIFILCIALFVELSTAAPLPLKPFVIDHQARTDSPVDVSFLLDAPAGKDGFLGTHDGHLFFPNGKRFRAWGVNCTGWTTGSTNLPPKTAAAHWAAEMARYGINCVRFHFLDMTTDHFANKARRRQPVGLVDAHRNDSQVFDGDQLDRLDFFIAQLKKRGIYANLNLNVGRTYKPGDEVPDSDLITQAKGMTYFGDRLLELQRDYAKQLLTHYNPYTKSTYAHEPAIAIVELVNENSVFEFWDRNWLRGERVPGGANYQLDLTPFYKKDLDRKYNAWLKQTLKPDALSELHKTLGLPADAPIPRLHREQIADSPPAQFDAEVAFYTHLETGFFEDMKTYLREKLGVQSLIVGTADHTYFIPNLPLIRSTSRMDILDGHVYWQHPAIWGARNTPMVNDPLHSTIIKLARTPMAGKPFTVSEVNHPNPNDYAAEMIPILAGYAAFQDWDGIFFYTFEPKVEPGWTASIPDNFDITQDPVKMPQMASGALLFLRGDVAPAKETITRTYSTEQVNATMRMPESARPYYTPGFPLSLPLRHGSRIACLDCSPTAPFDPDPFDPAAPTATLESDTHELTWTTSEKSGGLVRIDSPRTQALVGFVRDNKKQTRHLLADVKNDFCALMLSSLDGQPIARAKTLLLTAGSRAENTGTQWNDRHTLWSTWGHAPSLIEPVTGWLTLKDIEGAVAMQLIPLDGAARPLGKPAMARRLEEGWEVPLGDPATTQYQINVMR